jgi:hypothetical protein
MAAFTLLIVYLDFRSQCHYQLPHRNLKKTRFALLLGSIVYTHSVTDLNDNATLLKYVYEDKFNQLQLSVFIFCVHGNDKPFLLFIRHPNNSTSSCVKHF